MAKKILVIDDDGAILDSLSAILSAQGYDVVVASDGEAGLDQFHAHHPGLIITDILMPGQEGIETILQIRKESPDVKIIAMSGGGRAGGRSFLQAAKKFGADMTIDKPFDVDAMIRAVEQCLA